MTNSAMQAFVSLLTSGCLLSVTAAPPSIGVVRSSGEFQVDGSTVRDNATVFDGSTIQTSSPSSIHLSIGAEMVLTPGSRVQVYKDHLVLQQGSQRIKNGRDYMIEAASLQISPADTRTVAEVVTGNNNRVSVAASEGLVDVRNGAGVLVATVRPGFALAFDAQAGGAATATKLSGCLVKKGDKYLLTDGTTNVTVELRGSDVARSVGHLVEITGSMIPGASPVAGASQVIEVVTVDSVGAACAAGVSKAAAAGAGAGLSAVAIGAIVGGVAVAGTLLGLGVAGTFSGKTAAPVSTP